ncbi:DNA polymerase phi-domain-containing protein [Globomyces pollinis-pini]|nr:DNA polymerase phi-domain-containing protein [Globomyces pollinis-pini]
MKESLPATLNQYWDLASIDPIKRNNATLLLIQALTTIQSNFNNENSLINDSNAMAESLAPEVQYALKRLLRGLASSRDAARQGFAVALTELLILLPNLAASLTLSLLHDLTEKNGTKTGQEERELFFGRLFGYLAIAKAGVFNRDSTTINDFSLVISTIFKYSDKKDYLKESCCLVLIQILANSKEHKEYEAISTLIIETYLKDKISTVEHIWFTLHVKTLVPEFSGWGKLLPDWKRSDITYVKNKKKLIDILQSTHYHNSTIHPVYTTLLKSLSNNQDSTSLTIFEFWAAVEESFFTSTHERKFLGFQIFLEILPLVSNEQVALIITPHFLRCLINSLHSKETYLNKQAKLTAGRLTTYAEENPSVALPLAMQLLNGNHRFDLKTKTKTVENILSTLTEDGIMSYLEYLTKVFFTPSLLILKNEDLELLDRNDTVRLWVLDQMCLLIRTGKMKKSEKWLVYIVKFIVVHGIFEVTKRNESDIIFQVVTPELSSTTRTTFRERLLTSLGYLNAITLKVGEESYPAGELPSGQSWSVYICSIITGMQKMKHLKLNQTFTTELQTSVGIASDMIASIGKLKSKTTDKTLINEYQAFQSIFSHSFIKHYIQPQQEGDDIIPELKNCFELMYPIKNKDKKRKLDEEEHLPIEVLTDILISLLDKPSAVLRTLATDVFKVFAPKSTEKVFELLYGVISVPSGVHGAEELFEDEEAEENDDANEEESDDDDDDDVSVDDSGMDEPVDEQLRADIKKAMDLDVEQDLDDLDDDEMAPFDAKLSEIFRHRKSLKKSKKETKESVLHFKLRVTDLLDIYLKGCITQPFIINSVEPLLKLYLTITATDDKLLRNKLGSLLQTRFCNAKHIPAVTDTDAVVVMLGSIHELCGKLADVQSSKICSGVSIFLIKSILHAQSLDVQPSKAKKAKTSAKADTLTVLDRVSDIYKASFTSFLTGKNTQFKLGLFTDLTTKCFDVSWKLLPFYISCLALSDLKPFAIVQTFEITSNIIKSVTKPTDDMKKTLQLQLATYIKHVETIFTTIESRNVSKDRVKTILKTMIAVFRKVKVVFAEGVTGGSLLTCLEATLELECYRNAPGLKTLLKQLSLLL